jgi:hypothetical protein
MPEGRVVIERVGVRGESISFRDASGRLLFACDNSPGPRENNHPWCGEAVGELQNRHLTDSQLGVGCKAGDREPIGFAWIEPGAGARYVAVEQPGYTEVYEVALGLPVRVSTSSDADGETATIRYTEHDGRGALLRRAELETSVAG